MRPQVPAPHVRSLTCPNCGGAVEIRGMAHTLNAVCIQCLSIIDARSPELRVIQQFRAKERVRPLIPLGTRGKLHGDPYEVIGFQVRTINVEGVDYSWHEYLIFNPYKGFRYLSFYNGHWNDIKPIKGIPVMTESLGRKAAVWLGTTYKHFQNAKARTTYVMGEFPYRVQVGETATVDDYVNPPYMLSSETTPDEVVWSLGEYHTGEDIWKHFNLPGSPPPAVGVFANQPSPYSGSAGRWFRLAGLLWLITLGVLILTKMFAAEEQVLARQYTYDERTPGEHSIVTPVFELKGRPSSVEIGLYTNLYQNWAFFNVALINEETGRAWDFGSEVSYYSGSDWSEGSSSETVRLPRIPAGRYYLRIEPEMDDAPNDGYTTGPRNVTYTVVVNRDMPTYWPFVIAFLLIPVPAIMAALRSFTFEHSRWQESDYATASGDDDE
jgi:hypothetical protein